MSKEELTAIVANAAREIMIHQKPDRRLGFMIIVIAPPDNAPQELMQEVATNCSREMCENLGRSILEWDVQGVEVVKGRLTDKDIN